MTLDLVSTLCDLVRIPSVNPMGRPVSGDEYFEYRLTNYLDDLFKGLGVRYERQYFEPKRDNIVARLDGDPPLEKGGGLVMLEAHQDTVPVEGMTIPPWTPEVRDGRVYGRGSCDIKGGMASMLWAFSRLIHERPSPRPTVIMGASVNEEFGFHGAAKVAQVWRDTKSIIPRCPDGVIVAEPTLLNVVVAHKGVARWRCHTRGRAAHSSRPEHGDNAIYAMARVLSCLERYAKSVVPTLKQHRWVGSPTLSVGIISGGISVNTVPDHCVIEIDRRVLPGEDSVAARQHVIDFIQAQVDATIEHDPPFISTLGLSDDSNAALAKRVAEMAKPFGGGQLMGVPFGTNAPSYAGQGAPTIVLGPGSIDQAHTADEWVAIDQLQSAGEIYYEFLRRVE